MSDHAPAPMTADAFLAWTADQPDGARYELAAGRVVKMSAERAVHTRTKFPIARQLFDAVQAAKLLCEVFADGMAVAIDGATIYELRALLRCGPALADDAVKITDPTTAAYATWPPAR